jgi:hypothetical protein
MRLVGAVCFIGLCPGVVGCTTGDTPVMPNGRLCGSTLSANGTFAPDPNATPPVDGTGCWPAGTWTFSMSIVENDCSPAPTLESQYQFKGEQTLDMNGDPVVDTFTYLTDPSARAIVKVSEGGAGLCEGEVDLYSTDGKTVWLLKPELNADNTITGDGEYGVFSSDQWPFGS